MDLNVSRHLLCNETHSTNRTFDCEPFELRVFHGVIMAVILLLSLGLNFTVLVLLLHHKKLRNKSVVGLIVADICMTTIWVFQAEASTVAGEWPFGDRACSALSYFYITLLFVRWLEVLVFTMDRFCQIVFPFWYQRWSNTLVIVSTALAWSLPAILALPPAALNFASYSFALTACTINCGENTSCVRGIIPLFGLFITTGGIVPTVMYIIIFFYGLRKKRSMTFTLQLGTGEGIPRSTSYNQGATKFLNVLHNKKAIITCFLVFITNIITNIPLYITSSLRNQEQIYRHIPIWLHFLIMYLFLLGPVLDPLVIMRTRDFRETIRRLVCCERRSQGTVATGLRAVFSLTVIAPEQSKQQQVLHSESGRSNPSSIDTTTCSDSSKTFFPT